MTKPASVPDHFYRQSGVIPLRRRKGKVEVLLVTTRSGKRWVVPKGVVEEGLTPAESALREAWEEAGLRGRMGKESVGRFGYSKWQGICTVEVFPLAVHEEASSWPEGGTRLRRWMSPKEAAATVREGDLGALILEAARREGGKAVKRLVLFRHAKSSWKHPVAADFDRPLNERGKREAPIMAERLAARGIAPDLILTSPAKRAMKTARSIARAFDYPKSEIRRDREIYLADLETLVSIVREIEEEKETVILVGHNPGFTDLANCFTGGEIENVPTCGIAGIDFPADSWAKAKRGTGTLLFFDYPKKLGE
jgi:phosphohistidine phosphatase